MTYYIKGGSKFEGDAPANPTVWCALTLLGFPDAKYLDVNWKEIGYEGIIDSQDPFWMMGSATGGAKEFEFGLYNHNRIKIDATGYWYWDGDSWEDLLAGGGGGAHTLGGADHTDVTITGPADNEVLAYDNGSSEWINQTPAEAGLSVAGHGHGQLHDEDHDNTHHTTNYHTEADGTGVFTVHSDVTNAGSGIIISNAERNALHSDVIVSVANVQAVSINAVSEDPAPKMYIEDALSSDGDFEGIILTITHSEAFGKAVYVSGNNTGADADKDAIGTMLAIGISVGTNKVLILGTIREDDWNWTANDTIFVGDDGALTNDVSGYTAGDMVQVVGVAVDPNTVLVKGLDWVEIV